jgi:hypothetical protein
MYFFVLFRSLYCLCVYVYCHRLATQLQLTNISYHMIYHSISNHISYHNHILSYLIISYHIISYIIPYYIIYYIISYRTVSYHIYLIIISYYIIKVWLSQVVSSPKVSLPNFCMHLSYLPPYPPHASPVSQSLISKPYNTSHYAIFSAHILPPPSLHPVKSQTLYSQTSSAYVIS